MFGATLLAVALAQDVKLLIQNFYSSTGCPGFERGFEPNVGPVPVATRPHTNCYDIGGGKSVKGNYCDLESGRYKTYRYLSSTDCTGTMFTVDHTADGGTCVNHGEDSAVYMCLEMTPSPIPDSATLMIHNSNV